MQRITDKHLQQLCDYINELTNSPKEPYTREESGSVKANIGNYHLYHAYGGVCLHRMVNDGGGIRTPLMSGCVTKRELYNAMQNYIAGLNDVRFKEVKVKELA